MQFFLTHALILFLLDRNENELFEFMFVLLRRLHFVVHFRVHFFWRCCCWLKWSFYCLLYQAPEVFFFIYIHCTDTTTQTHTQHTHTNCCHCGKQNVIRNYHNESEVILLFCDYVIMSFQARWLILNLNFFWFYLFHFSISYRPTEANIICAFGYNRLDYSWRDWLISLFAYFFFSFSRRQQWTIKKAFNCTFWIFDKPSAALIWFGWRFSPFLYLF